MIIMNDHMIFISHGLALMADATDMILFTRQYHQNHIMTMIIMNDQMILISRGLALMADATNMSLLNRGFAHRIAHQRVSPSLS